MIKKQNKKQNNELWDEMPLGKLGPIRDVKMYREGPVAARTQDVKPHMSYFNGTPNKTTAMSFWMSYYDFFLCLHVYFFVQKCLHVTECCKYFILSSVILPLNVEWTAVIPACTI